MYSACVLCPDFNRSIWEELMPQSRRVSVTVQACYNATRSIVKEEGKLLRQSSESPPALLPESFTLAKDWLLQQQKPAVKPFT